MDTRRRYLIIFVLLHQMMIRTLLMVSLLVRRRASSMRRPRRTLRTTAVSYKMTQRLHAQMIHLRRIIDLGDVQCVVNLRMNHNAFANLCYLVTHVGGLNDSRYVRIEDRATGERVETFAAAARASDNMKDSFPNYDDMDIEDFINPFEGADDSISVTHTPSSRSSVGTKFNSKKRKHISEEDDHIVAAINNLANITKETMSDLIKEIAAESKKSEANISNAMDSVLEILYTIPELSSDEKVQVAELLVDNPNKLALFLRLDRDGRLSLSRRLIAP